MVHVHSVVQQTMVRQIFEPEVRVLDLSIRPQPRVLLRGETYLKGIKNRDIFSCGIVLHAHR